ncbi:SRPBCC family protein [Amycolatopsis vancoresmycina]|uniref:Activator of Hsp90 ATPase 1 family protein n=1 Tax=Amycolatopsis vancoresmycina DSM 44592 TaxID=1292037 RepID=R1I9J6_9PSEU|nr:SRPBCC family protein [Amycolatopsis vancoresmycina]EOD67049.1 activator of Hsp90 ATPase 1 family protein [Amycolatopsis vancoresmycina DSM 44592]
MEITTPADDRILITREFDAPKHLVYRVWTTPELVRRWWSGHRGTTTEVEMDLRPGGRWRYVLKSNDGAEVGFHGEYREIVPDERLVYTEVYEMPGVDLDSVDGPLNTVTFTALDGDRTRLELLTETGSKELRDTILQSGMEIGVAEQMVLIQELADSLR